MNIKVSRLVGNENASIGLLAVDGKFQCFTVEDEKREVKLKAETRIPEGKYDVVYRVEGSHHEKYKQKYGANHFGMLHIINVPNFQFILIHIGNTEKDTEGCLLVGDSLNSNFTVSGSTIAYEKLYKIVSDALNKKEKVTIEFIDLQNTIL